MNPFKQNLETVFNEGRLIRRSWDRTSEDGKQLLCLYTAYFNDPEARPQTCPSWAMPEFMANLMPWIDDAPSDGKWEGFIKRLISLSEQFYDMSPEKARRWDLLARKAALETAVKHDKSGSCNCVLSLIDRELEGDVPGPEEWTSARAASTRAWAASARAAEAEAEASRARARVASARAAEAESEATWAASARAAEAEAEAEASRAAAWAAESESEAAESESEAAWVAAEAAAKAGATSQASDQIIDSMLTYWERESCRTRMYSDRTSAGGSGMNTILAVDHDLEPRRFAIVRVYTDGTRLLEKDCLTLQETAMYPAGPQTDDKGEFRYSQTLSSSLPKE